MSAAADATMMASDNTASEADKAGMETPKASSPLADDAVAATAAPAGYYTCPGRETPLLEDPLTVQQLTAGQYYSCVPGSTVAAAGGENRGVVEGAQEEGEGDNSAGSDLEGAIRRLEFGEEDEEGEPEELVVEGRRGLRGDVLSYPVNFPSSLPASPGKEEGEEVEQTGDDGDLGAVGTGLEEQSEQQHVQPQRQLQQQQSAKKGGGASSKKKKNRRKK
jgi:hypothetical protein